jgi:proline dehydrogenase
VRELLAGGVYPAIATHDVRLIEATKRVARERGLAADRFEFQLLYGIRRDLQEMLLREGYRVRIYVPYGTEWYPYLMRRLAERPANLLFIVRSVLRERRAA